MVTGITTRTIRRRGTGTRRSTDTIRRITDITVTMATGTGTGVTS